MVTGASTADLAVILVDARKGVLVQTRRHSYLCHLLGIRNLVLAVNKMDLVGYDQATLRRDRRRLHRFRREHRDRSVHRHADLGLQGRQHHRRRRANTPWYRGPAWSRISRRSRSTRRVDAGKPFRMPVQWVNRPNLDFRGFSGLIATRQRQAGRCGAGAAVGQDQHGRRRRSWQLSTAICDASAARPASRSR